MREFICTESDQVVGNLLLSLMDYYSNFSLANNIQNKNTHLIAKCESITNKLLGKKIQTETDLINHNIHRLKIDTLFTYYIVFTSRTF